VSPERSATFRSLRHRNARLYFVGLVVSNVGTWLQATATAWLVLELTDSGTALGVAVACQFLPMLLLGAWAGVLADRLDRRRLVFATQAAMAVQALVLGALDLAGLATIGVVYALAVVLGVLSAVDNPARRSFITELVEPDELSNAMSLNTAVMTGSRVAGPALAGVLIKAVGTGWCFVLNGASFAAVLLAIVLMDRARIHRTPPAPHRKGQVREGLRYAWGNPTLRLALVTLLVVSTFSFNYQVTLPLLVEREFGGGAGLFGLLLSVTSLGSVLGSLVTARRATASVRYFLVALGVLGGSMLALALSPAIAVAFALSVPMGAGGAAFIASSSGLLLVASRADMRGRMLALQATAFLGSTPIGGPVIGWVGQTFGARWSLAVGAVAALLTLAVAAPLAVRSRAARAAALTAA
jgi:MFS family permease